MSGLISFCDALDRLCGQFATALHNSELHVYAMLGLAVLLSMVMFPPKDDPDQI